MKNNNWKLHADPRLSDDNTCLWITYRYRDEDVQGIANTVHRVLSDESYGFERQVRHMLWLQEGDVLLQIDSFHPNGIQYSENDMRKWRGKKFLDAIIEEAKRIWAKWIYTWALTEYMRTFLEKYGFDIFEQPSSIWTTGRNYLCIKKEALK